MTHIVLVSGASRGFGQALAVAYTQQLTASASDAALSVLYILVARTKAGLERTQEAVQKVLPPTAVSRFYLLDLDLSDTAHIHKLIQQVEGSTAGQSFTSAALFNNVGSLPDLSKKLADYDWTATGPYWNLNVNSVLAISSWFVQMARTRVNGRAFVVNTSSLLAIKAFPFWNLYSIGKSARDMIHMQIATEEDEKKIVTVNYAPGPLNNDMMKEVLANLGDPGALSYYKSLEEQGKLVSESDSATKIVRLLFSEKGVVNGAHLDYYDV